MTATYRLSAAAEADVVDILSWSHDQFGDQARERYEVLLATAFRDIADDPRGIGAKPRPDLGEGLFSWHLRGSRDHVPPVVGTVQKPRHFVIYRRVADVVEIVRVLHDAMDQSRHLLGEKDAD